jgi:hypothetical protein
MLVSMGPFIAQVLGLLHGDLKYSTRRLTENREILRTSDGDVRESCKRQSKAKHTELHHRASERFGGKSEPCVAL